MADHTDRAKENIAGSFFVDTSCIACDTCVGIAPGYFSLTANCDHAYVKSQPQTEVEKTLCRRAIEKCPVQAIGEH